MLTSFKFRVVLALSLLMTVAAAAQQGHYFLRDTFCANQSIFVVNQVFGPSNPSGTVTIPGGAFNGADSVIHVQLTINQPVEVTLSTSHCEGDTVIVNGTAYHANFYLGEEVVQEGAANGCDSIIHVQLNFRPVYFNYTVPVCEGDTVWINGTAYDAFLNKEGVEVIPGTPCDSILLVQVQPITPPFSNLRDTLCPDGFYLINGTRYDFDNRAGYEILPNASSSGCDSIVAIDLEFRNLWVYIGEDREIIKGDTVCITPQFALPPVSVSWLPTAPCADSTCVDPCIQLTAPITFTYVATDASGCVLRDDVRFSISTKNRVYAPNVFAPDARWPNNRFYLSCDRTVVNVRQMVVADRWGDIMFDQSNISPGDPEAGWDGSYKGTVMNPGVYIFWAELERYDGTTFIEKGNVTLIR